MNLKDKRTINTTKPLGIGSLPIDDKLYMATNGLFWERRHCNVAFYRGVPPPYTLKRQDHLIDGVTYKSMYLIYMTCATEYEAAMKLVGTLPHWQKLCKSPWFYDELLKWREDMRLRDEAMAKQILLAAAKEGDLSAARSVIKLSQPKTRSTQPKKAQDRVQDSMSLDQVDELLDHADSVPIDKSKMN
jgi:hypothetical protein